MKIIPRGHSEFVLKGNLSYIHPIPVLPFILTVQRGGECVAEFVCVSVSILSHKWASHWHEP